MRQMHFFAPRSVPAQSHEDENFVGASLSLCAPNDPSHPCRYPEHAYPLRLRGWLRNKDSRSRHSLRPCETTLWSCRTRGMRDLTAS
jgi:hypothetical protein